MSDSTLGENLIVDEAAVPAPPAPPPPPGAGKAAPIYFMSEGEAFTREQYHTAGWGDDQLIAAGKMRSGISLVAPIGMPASTWVILDDNDNIPPTGLFVGHNGTGFLIQTGVPVQVPDHVLAILDDAVMGAAVVDPTTLAVLGYRNRPVYTYRRVAAPAT